MAFLFKADDTIGIVEPAGKTFSLQELQELQSLVGGFIEVVKGRGEQQFLVIDEEGKLKNKPRNERATAEYIYGEHDAVVGDAVLCMLYELQGDAREEGGGE